MPKKKSQKEQMMMKRRKMRKQKMRGKNTDMMPGMHGTGKEMMMVKGY